MPRSAPAEHANFPVFQVRAKCPCGREGWTKAFREYPDGTVLLTTCSRCVDQIEARVAQLHEDRLTGLKKKPERTPREHKPHWTDLRP